MNSDYMFLCGVMWCRLGRQDAGKELPRVATSMDPEMRVLARAMWATGALSLEEFRRTGRDWSSPDPWRKLMWMTSCALCKALLHKVRLCDSVRCQCGWIW